MTLSMTRKNKRGELPKNIRKGLIAHAEGVTWEDSAELAGVSTYEMKQWRAHPQAQSLIDTAMNLNLEESLGTLAQATPALANRLIYIALDPKVKVYTAVSAIQSAFNIIQSGIIDRENKVELRKLREAVESLEQGGTSDLIDI